MKKEITVKYDNGTTQQAQLAMSDICYAETKLARDGISFDAASKTGMMHAIYHRLRKGGQVAEPFDNWLDRVDEIDAPEPDGEEDASSFTD